MLGLKDNLLQKNLKKGLNKFDTIIIQTWTVKDLLCNFYILKRHMFETFWRHNWKIYLYEYINSKVK